MSLSSGKRIACNGRRALLPSHYALLATTALISTVVLADRVSAQATIDGNTVETVPGTHASPWNVGGLLTVGANSGGHLTIAPNSVVSSTSSVIGQNSTSVGEVNLNGADFLNTATWNAGTSLVVGGAGFGTITGSNGVLQSGQASVGAAADSIGRVALSNSSSWGNAGTLIIGNAGVGDVRVDSGSTLDSGDVEIGGAAGSRGKLTIAGDHSSWTGTGNVTVGGAGQGELTVSDSAVATTTSGLSTIGAQARGTALVTGSGSGWNTGELTVGGFSGSDGRLTIENGGAMTSTGEVRIGSGAGSNGFVTVTGAGSSWSLSNLLSVGADGGGALIVEDGATVHGALVTAGIANGHGSIVVRGQGSTLISDLGLGIGVALTGQGSGSLEVEFGGQVIVNGSDALIGFNGAAGYAVVRGTGSLLQISSADLHIAGNSTAGTTGDFAIQDGATVRVNGGTGIVHVAEGAGSAGQLSIGGMVPLTPPPGVISPEAPGTLEAAAVNLGTSSARLNFFHTSTNYVFAPVIQGVGSVNVMAGTTILTGDSSAFAGTTTIQDGILVVNGSLGGTVDVQAAGRLQGSGTIGTLTVGGTIAPGNSIGTMTVGSVTFGVGSTYEVEVNAAGASDRIVAAGMATINGGSVKVLAGTGTYAPATTYTILSAAGGRTGTFTEGVTSNLAFLDPSLSYDANNVYLTMTRNDLGFQGVAVTRNQIATAGGVERLGVGNVVYNAVLNLSAGQARSAFDQLSGEVHASARTTMIQDSQFIRNAANDRIRAAFGSVGASRVNVAAYVDCEPVTGSASPNGLAVWGQGFGSWGYTDSDGNAARLNRSIGGFLFGADAPVFDTWRLGVLAGYSRSSFDVKDRQSSGASNNYHVGLYGGTTWGDLALRMGAVYTWNDFSTSRSVTFPGFANSLSGSYTGGAVQGFGELGYGFARGPARFEPFANLAYVSAHTDGFTERGGAAALASQSATTDATFTTFGLRAATTFDVKGAALAVQGSAGWRHAYGDVAPLSTVRFASGGDAFPVGGVQIARDAAVIEAGLDYALSSKATFGVTYGGQFASGASDQSFKARFNLKF